jgi:hypothetical protein
MLFICLHCNAEPSPPESVFAPPPGATTAPNDGGGDTAVTMGLTKRLPGAKSRLAGAAKARQTNPLTPYRHTTTKMLYQTTRLTKTTHKQPKHFSIVHLDAISVNFVLSVCLHHWVCRCFTRPRCLVRWCVLGAIRLFLRPRACKPFERKILRAAAPTTAALALTMVVATAGVVHHLHAEGWRRHN